MFIFFKKITFILNKSSVGLCHLLPGPGLLRHEAGQFWPVSLLAVSCIFYEGSTVNNCCSLILFLGVRWWPSEEMNTRTNICIQKQCELFFHSEKKIRKKSEKKIFFVKSQKKKKTEKVRK